MSELEYYAFDECPYLTSVYFQGNAPANCDENAFNLDQPDLVIYYMVPLRFVSEAFGATVNWDGGNKFITIDLAK